MIATVKDMPIWVIDLERKQFLAFLTSTPRYSTNEIYTTAWPIPQAALHAYQINALIRVLLTIFC